MILTLLCIIHENVAKTFIPYYKLKYEAREAANRLSSTFENDSKKFYTTTEHLKL